ncbi:putative pentatricopeptide repeat-containing protein At5g08310, mitochondrial [Lycium ferocissimum]|uniref:putative pentatricopeptide repeat-containing protein At5g08310, mitochondrial n=1 Tax=Lycium ferocissimum TaxID=112874 RepID=UPI0028164B54|nr:putative pentatricopeptide repeat-containing protein At5g08310, mitochondrial [Lycium ferocissimum]XP_059309218.1 putative pentatricopeptide repeat-containing protein At5g08310, mitochondrial [Lycium ferocissimum]XP_059309219.1 putative pentatricopeptide repeat-containing protein At5g08310, mitochondrial [Lycium ferocissimum]XP_059309220.1 putative pentatricopeptide repeat-containing protein At5g08310, mitochondrial [Lycium ferocissimum]XP_059309221.1 putative pentatricopeptide repeat-contai
MAALCRIKRPHFLFFNSFKQLLNLCTQNNLYPFSSTPTFQKYNLSSFSSTPTFQKHINSLPPISLEESRIIDKLIHIFTKPLSTSKNQELDELGSKITPFIVEIVLRNLKSWRIAHLFFNWASNQKGYSHNCHTFNLIAECLSGARQNDSMRVLVNDVVKFQCYFTPRGLGFFIRCLGNLKLVKEANELFDHMKKSGLCVPNSFTYNCLLDAISKVGDCCLIELRLKEMCSYGWELDKYAFTPVLQCYCNAGDFENALVVFNEMHEKGLVDAHVLSILLVSFSKWGKIDKAFELVERIEDLKISLNEKTCFVLIHGFVREGRTDKALQLLDKMRKMGFVLDISVYGVLIEELCKNKEIEKAMQLYEDMNVSGVRPDIKILSDLLSCVRDERDMIRIVEERYESLDPKAKMLLYNSVLKGLINNGSTDKAYRLLCASTGLECGGDFNEDSLFFMKELACPNTVSFEIVIDGLCRADRLEMARRLFRDMDHIGCKRSVLLYNNLIDSLSRSGRLDECYELLNEMKQSEFQPTHYTYNSIFGCLCKQGDAAGALAMVREMRVHGHQPWIKYYTLLMKKLCKDGQAVKASNFLADMVQEGFLPDVVGYSAVIDGLVKIKQLDKALDLFREICARGYCPDVVAYNIMINGLCKDKRVLEAQDFLDEMMDKGLIPSVVTYNSLIDGWCKNGDVDRAMEYLTRMTEKEREPNVITYTTLIDGLCNAGKPNDAISLLVKMEASGCSPNRVTFTALISGLCNCRKLDDALIYLQEMERKDMKPDPSIYIVLIEAFIKNLNPNEAYDLLKKVVHDKSLQDLLNSKSRSILKEAILSLSADPKTSSNVKILLEGGHCTALCSISEIG